MWLRCTSNCLEVPIASAKHTYLRQTSLDEDFPQSFLFRENCVNLSTNNDVLWRNPNDTCKSQKRARQFRNWHETYFNNCDFLKLERCKSVSVLLISKKRWKLSPFLKNRRRYNRERTFQTPRPRPPLLCQKQTSMIILMYINFKLLGARSRLYPLSAT